MPGLSDKSAKKELLDCLLCRKSFSIQDVRDEEYFETGICRKCYEAKEKDPTTCFAKMFDPMHPACKEFCPDKRICGEVFIFISG